MIRVACNVALSARCVLIGAVLLITAFACGHDQPNEEFRNILCSYEQRAHEAWEMGSEVGPEPLLRECD